MQNDQEQNVEQPVPQQGVAGPDQQEQNIEGDQEKGKKPQGRVEEIITKLEELTGDKKKATRLFWFSVVAGILLPVAIIVALLPKPQRQQPVEPEATPSLAPVVKDPTPTPTMEAGTVDQLLEDIDSFDVRQSDLTPPKMDEQIAL